MRRDVCPTEPRSFPSAAADGGLQVWRLSEARPFVPRTRAWRTSEKAALLERGPPSKKRDRVEKNGVTRDFPAVAGRVVDRLSSQACSAPPPFRKALRPRQGGVLQAKRSAGPYRGRKGGGLFMSARRRGAPFRRAIPTPWRENSLFLFPRAQYHPNRVFPLSRARIRRISSSCRRKSKRPRFSFILSLLDDLGMTEMPC